MVEINTLAQKDTSSKLALESSLDAKSGWNCGTKCGSNQTWFQIDAAVRLLRTTRLRWFSLQSEGIARPPSLPDRCWSTIVVRQTPLPAGEQIKRINASALGFDERCNVFLENRNAVQANDDVCLVYLVCFTSRPLVIYDTMYTMSCGLVFCGCVLSMYLEYELPNHVDVLQVNIARFCLQISRSLLHQRFEFS